MGSQKDTMVLFAERDIHRFFSEFDGWKTTPLNLSRSNGSLYRLSRYKYGGDEVALVAVSLDPVPKEETINELDALPDSRDSRTKKFLLMPQGAITEVVPPHIRTIPMSAFAADDGKLVWLTKKKNARRFVPELPVAA